MIYTGRGTTADDRGTRIAAPADILIEEEVKGDADGDLLDYLATPTHRGDSVGGRKTTYKIPVLVMDRLEDLTGRARRDRRLKLLRVRVLEMAVEDLSIDHPGLGSRQPRSARRLLPVELPEDLLWKVADLAADGAVRLDMGDVITVALNDMLVRIEQQLDRLDENGASDA